MFVKFTINLKWLIKVGYFFVIKKPFSIFFLVILSILSQVLNLVIFLIPFKIIFILVSDNFSAINFYFLNISTKNQFVFSSILLIIFLFFILILTEILNKKLINLNYNYFYSLEQKFHNFENDNLGMILFDKFIFLMSSFIFLICLSGLLVYIYPNGIIMIYLLWISFILLTMFLHIKSKKFESFFSRDSHLFINYANFVIFILIFIFMCYEQLNIQTMNFIYIFFFIIVLRQFNISLIGIYKSLEIIIDKKIQFEKIFFPRTSKNISIEIKEFNQNLFKFLDKELYEKVLLKIAVDKINRNSICKNIQWHSLGTSKIIGFSFDVYISNENIYGTYFVKIFHPQLKIKANQEAAICQENNISDLCLKFINYGIFQNFPYHIYEFQKISNINKEVCNKINFIQRLLVYEPSEILIRKYRNTHKLIHERITKLDLNLLELEFNKSESYKYITWMQNNFNDIKNMIEKLPLRIVIPNIDDSILFIEDNKVKTLSFFNWSIEPLGFCVGVNPSEMALLNLTFNIKDFKLAQIIQQLKFFENNINQFKLNDALKNIKKIKVIYAELNL